MAEKIKRKRKYAMPAESYNDYHCITEGYLENWNSLVAAIDNMNVLLREKKEELAIAQEAAPPVSHIGQTSLFGGGSANKLTQPEAAYEKVQGLNREVKALQQEIKKLETLIGRLNRARMHLRPEMKRLVELRYVEDAFWEDIEAELHYTERWCRALLEQAIEEIAVALFGPKAIKKKAKEKFKFLG